MARPKKRTHWLRWGLALLILTLALALLAFPFGPLFPWSPWKPGYRLSRSFRADVFYPRSADLIEAYGNIDAAIAGAEKFLGLPAPNRITVILCPNWNDFERMLPHMRTRALSGVTLATGTIVYITPKLDEKGFDHGEFLRHELTHAVMHQNQTIRNALAIGDIQWLSEGLAVSYGQQAAYLSRAEFLNRAKTQDLLPILSPEHRAATQLDMRFAYPAWRYFPEHSRRAKGQEKFLDFVHASMMEPTAWPTFFEEILGQKFEAAVLEFQTAVRASAD